MTMEDLVSRVAMVKRHIPDKYFRLNITRHNAGEIKEL